MGQLVLDRKPGQSIILELPDGRTVAVTVTRIHRNRATGKYRVKLGISAARDIGIWRQELLDGHNDDTELEPQESPATATD